MTDDLEMTMRLAIQKFESDMKARDERESRMAADLESIREHVEQNYVKLETFRPIQRLGYAVGMGFTTIIIGAIASLILKQG